MSRVRDYRRMVLKEVKQHDQLCRRMLAIVDHKKGEIAPKDMRRLKRLEAEVQKQAAYIRKLAPGAPI